MTNMVISNEIFREKIVDNINNIVENKKMSINIEKSVFNYTLEEAKEKNIVRKWENKYFLQLYKNRLKSIYINLKNPVFLKKIKTKVIKTKNLKKMSHQENVS